MEENKNLTEEELGKVAGGGISAAMPANLTREQFEEEVIRIYVNGRKWNRVAVKYGCPKCGSMDVINLDPGELYKMRVACLKCFSICDKDGGKADDVGIL